MVSIYLHSREFRPHVNTLHRRMKGSLSFVKFYYLYWEMCNDLLIHHHEVIIIIVPSSIHRSPLISIQSFTTLKPCCWRRAGWDAYTLGCPAASATFGEATVTHIQVQTQQNAHMRVSQPCFHACLHPRFPGKTPPEVSGGRSVPWAEYKTVVAALVWIVASMSAVSVAAGESVIAPVTVKRQLGVKKKAFKDLEYIISIKGLFFNTCWRSCHICDPILLCHPYMNERTTEFFWEAVREELYFEQQCSAASLHIRYTACVSLCLTIDSTTDVLFVFPLSWIFILLNFLKKSLYFLLHISCVGAQLPSVAYVYLLATRQLQLWVHKNVLQ